MSCRIAVCDDDHAAIELLTGLTREWASQREVPIHMETFPSGDTP